MFCPKCGSYNDDSSITCMMCDANLKGGFQKRTPSGSGSTPRYRSGTTYHEPVRSGDIPTHMTEAILVTIFCSLLFGILAIVNAAEVTGKLSAGDYDGAQKASDRAKNWITIAVVLNLIIIVIAFLYGACSGFAG